MVDTTTASLLITIVHSYHDIVHSAQNTVADAYKDDLRVKELRDFMPDEAIFLRYSPKYNFTVKIFSVRECLSVVQ